MNVLSSRPRPEQTRGVPLPTLSEIIEGQLIAGDSEIHPTEDEPVRAIDVLEPYAAVYRFSADAAGAWLANCTLAYRADDGSWRDTGSSGTHGDALKLPWRPSSPTLNGQSWDRCSARPPGSTLPEGLPPRVDTDQHPRRYRPSGPDDRSRVHCDRPFERSAPRDQASRSDQGGLERTGVAGQSPRDLNRAPAPERRNADSRTGGPKWSWVDRASERTACGTPSTGRRQRRVSRLPSLAGRTGWHTARRSVTRSLARLNEWRSRPSVRSRLTRRDSLRQKVEMGAGSEYEAVTIWRRDAGARPLCGRSAGAGLSGVRGIPRG